MDEELFVDVSCDTYNYSFGYYSQNCWIDNENIVLARSSDAEMNKAVSKNAKIELVRINLVSGKKDTVTDSINCWHDYVVHGKKVFYVDGNELKVTDVDSGVCKILAKEMGINMPHITKDGKYISVFRCTPHLSTFFRIETDSGNIEKLYSTVFDEPYPYANHGMICPEDPEILFFSHEGDTKRVSDRLWIYDNRKKLACNIAKQRTSKEGEVLDCYGHESWSCDGKGVYFVRYRESEAPSGISYIDINSTDAKLSFKAHDYWHVSASPIGEYIAADTRNLGKDTSGVVIINLETKEEIMIDRVRTSFRHPCHPHPSFSPDNSKIIYCTLNEENKCSVRIRRIKTH